MSLAGWDIGVIKLADAAIDIAIIRLCGEIPIVVAVFRAMGAMSTTTAGMGMTHVASMVRDMRPNMIASGP